jgi:drug/metabolite transporter (DMT)-like permease
MVEVWFFYIISAVVIFGFNAIVDKIILTKHLNSFSYLVAGVPAKLAYIVGIVFFVPIDFNSFLFYLSFAAGALGVLGYYAYAFAMKREEASRISALTSLYPVFVAILAAIFIYEIFSITTYAGIVLMVLGATLISYKRTKFYRLIPAVVIVIAVLANVFWGIEQVMSKIVLQSYQFWEFSAAYMMGVIFMTIPSLAVPHFRKNLIKEFKKLPRNTILLITFSSSIWFIGIALFFYSVSLGPITLVSTLSITSPFAVLLLTLLLSKFWPKILKEEIDRKTVTLKLLAIVLIFLGTYLIVV